MLIQHVIKQKQGTSFPLALQVDFETAAERLNAKLADTEAAAEQRKGQMQAEVRCPWPVQLLMQAGECVAK